MQEIINNIGPLIPIFFGSWALFLIFTIWHPQHYRNSFILMFALGMTLMVAAGLFGDSMPGVLLLEGIFIFLALLLVPFMLMFNGFVVMRRESRSMGNMLSLILGVIIFFGELSYFLLIFSQVWNNVSKWVRLLLYLTGNSVLYFSVLILSFVVYMIMIQFAPHIMKFDYVVIHGCGLIGGKRVSRLLSNRIDKAISIYNKCKVKPILIPSGGRGNDEDLSEAQAMKDYMLSKGIPEEHILMEDKSTTTMENLENSKNLIMKREGGHRTALVTSNYHMYRCILYARELDWKCVGMGAKVAWYYWPSAVLREFAAVFTRKKHFAWTVIGYVFWVLIPGLAFLL